MSNVVCELTESAGTHVRKLMERQNKAGALLRVSVMGGGCSGLSYKMAFEDQPGSGDNLFEQQGIKVAIDPRSALFLKGLVIDYQDGLNGAGFTYQNPNAKRSCGCGTSFSA
ncbi:MAG: iron-sulfur cluster assembly accessory protein [Bacteriovoracaceae bacterium]|nr:iron-sulfur cluster assembly accessory protein [Bacteriovoracaceae bacterium]